MRTRQRGEENGNQLIQAGNALQELVWTTRCVICDTPGELICAECARALPYIDLWQACPRCGTPFGRLICTECNHLMLAKRGRQALPYERCTSAVIHTDAVRHIVTAFKDGGERRLAPLIAAYSAATVSPGISHTNAVLTFIPSTNRARRQRGFDHTEETARFLAVHLHLPLARIFSRPRGRDQRGLSREERQLNMAGKLQIRPYWQGRLPRRVIVYDDVYTTGATLFAASDALRTGGCTVVRCVTFSRVWDNPR
ncbi:MAG: ComF family protein [Eggerthellaceae bacterium]|jgi:predicted amidophosphoribosyltransferase